MILADLQSPQLKSLDPSHVLVVTPIGSVEQHSLHLPVGTDSLIVAHVAAMLEQLRPRTVLLSPTLWYGASSLHLGFAGTISLDGGLLAEVLSSIVLSLHESTGLRRFLILNGHGANEAPMTLALERIRRAQASVEGYAATYWNPMFDAMAESGEQWLDGMGHACELETSMVLAISPQSVDQQHVEGDYRNRFKEEWLGTSRAWPDQTLHGGLGDPTRATAERGRYLLDFASRRLATLADRLLAQPLDT